MRISIRAGEVEAYNIHGVRMIHKLSTVSPIKRSLKTAKRVRKLRQADVAIVSHAKSGRTWLNAMISHVYHQTFGIDEHKLIRFDNFHRLHPEIPRIFFTHDNRKCRAKKPLASAKAYAGRRTILLVRDPRDVAVSSYFQGRRNVGSGRRASINCAPGDRDMFDFVCEIKLPLIIRFLKRWARNIELIPNVLVVRYEDLRARPAAVLTSVMDFVGSDYSESIIRSAVEFASFRRLREMEENRFFESDRLHPGDTDDPHSFKVRRGKVGGYKDYFTPGQLARIDAMIDNEDVARFGYLPRLTASGISAA